MKNLTEQLAEARKLLEVSSQKIYNLDGTLKNVRAELNQAQEDARSANAFKSEITFLRELVNKLTERIGR